MPPRTKQREVEQNGQVVRLSITLSPSLRKNLRIAAAFADQSIGEWAADTLEKAANLAVTKARG